MPGFPVPGKAKRGSRNSHLPAWRRVRRTGLLGSARDPPPAASPPGTSPYAHAGYGQAAPGYGQAAPGYGQAAPGYGQAGPGYGPGQPGGPGYPGYTYPGSGHPGYGQGGYPPPSYP